MPADVVVTDARIYTAGPQRGMAEALAVKDGNIVFVGNAADAHSWVGPRITTRDGIAHLQLGSPDDIARIGRDHLYIAYIYAWANVEPDYDMTVIPTRVMRKISETPLCSRPGSWANGFT